MDMYFYYKSITDVSLYNCSSLTSEEMNNMRAVRRPIRGVSSIVFGFSMAIVYVLCLHAMLQPKLASKACYKLMFCLGLYDLFAVIGTDFFQGYNLTVGSFFCDAPNLYYVFGCLHMMCWAGASYFCLYLSFNRMIEILKVRREIIDFFFSPSRTMFGCIVGVLYSFFYLFFQTPVLYSNIDGCIVPDPLRLLGKVSFDIRFRPLMANNYGIIVATFTLYGAFYIIFYKNVQRLTDGSYNHSYLHHQVFVQATLMCGFTLIFSLCYSLFYFLPTLVILPKFVFVAYQYTIGLQALIYLFCNESIRNGVKENVYKMVGMKPPITTNIDMKTNKINDETNCTSPPSIPTHWGQSNHSREL